MNKKNVIKTKSELGRTFGVALSTISKWVGLGMPVEEEGFDTGKIFKWYIEHMYSVWETRSGKADRDAAKEKYDKARTAQARQNARKLKRINDTDEGLLLYKDEVLAMMQAVGTVFRISADAIKKTRKEKDMESGEDINKLVEIFMAELEKKMPEINRVIIDAEGE